MSVKTSFSNLCVVLKEKLGNKVDKVVGKGLSANDFTTAYKTKLDGIATGATKITVDTTLSASSTNPVQNKAVNTAIINIKNDLINYYKKTETYSKTEIDTKISLIPKFSIKVVKTLPTTDISATTVYLKTSKTSLAGNLYDEYIYVDSKWELLGTQTVDLSGYVTTSSMNTALANKVDKVEGKGLSTNDYTTAEKNKLSGIATGANKTVVDSDISTTSTNPIQNKAVGLKFQGIDADIANIQEKVAATGWIEVEFPKNKNFDPASYLLYRRCGNMVSFYGEFRITKNEDSSNYINLLFKNLPKEDVAPEIFSLDRFINAPNASVLVAVQRDPRLIIGVWMEVRVMRNGWVSIDFRTYSEEPIATGNVYTLNVTYML